MRPERAAAKFPKGRLRDGEEIIAGLYGWIGRAMGRRKDRQVNGTLYVTNQRVCFHKKGLFSEHFQAIPLGRISSVESVTRLGYRGITFYTSDDELHFGSFDKLADFDRLVEYVESREA